MFVFAGDNEKSKAKDTFIEASNFPKSYEIRSRLDVKNNKDKKYGDDVQLHDTEKGSLIFWTRINKACFRTKKAFSQAMHTFFVKFLKENPLDTAEETIIDFTVHLFEDDEISGEI